MGTDEKFDLKFLASRSRFGSSKQLTDLVKLGLSLFEGDAQLVKSITENINHFNPHLKVNQRRVREILNYDLNYSFKNPVKHKRPLFRDDV